MSKYKYFQSGQLHKRNEDQLTTKLRKMVPDLIYSRSNVQNNKVGRNDLKYQLVTLDNLGFSIWNENASHVTFC